MAFKLNRILSPGCVTVLPCLLFAAHPLVAGEGKSGPLGKTLASKEPVEDFGVSGSNRKWRFSLGGAYRSLGGVHYDSDFRAPSLSFPSLFGPAFRFDPPIGDQTAPDGRVYLDGFVRPDAGTEVDGTTGYWGYSEASQVEGDALVFSALGSARSTSRETASGIRQASERDFESWGPAIALDYEFLQRGVLSVHGRVGLLYTGHDLSATSTRTVATEAARDFRFEFSDRYDLQGVIPPLAPYEGSPDGPGALIDAIPSERTLASGLVRERRGEFVSAMRQEFDLSLATISDGIAVEFSGDRASGFVSAGLSSNIADWSAVTDERVALRTGKRERDVKRWRDSAGDTDFKIGAYVEAGLGVKLNEQLSLSAFGRYDWTDSIDAAFGNSNVEIDLSGWSVGVALRFEF